DVGRQRSPPGWAGRGDGPGGTQGQHLPLHGLPQRRHGDRGRRQGDGSRAKVRALSMRDFVYHRASSLDEARRLGAEEGAAFLAGGQTLLRDLKHHRRTPTSLVKISGVLPRQIDLRDGGITIGAGATHAAVAISEVVRKRLPALAGLAEHIGDPAVRHRATLGGAVVAHEVAGDYPPACLALGATEHTTGGDFAAAELLAGPRRAARGAG